jgi:hypothetical protein
MCKRQIKRQSVTPTPSNDNNPKSVERLITWEQPGFRSGILSVALERAEHVRLDFVAGGVLTIQGQRSPVQSFSTLH